MTEQQPTPPTSQPDATMPVPPPPAQMPTAELPPAQTPPPPPPPPPAQAAPAYAPPPQGAQGYAPQQNPMSPGEERTVGLSAHGIAAAATFFSAGTLGFVAALVLYLMYKDRGPFARAHTANALNVQITAGIIMLISLPLMLVLIGFATYGIAFVMALVLHIQGAIKASDGQWWDPPFTIKFVR